VGNTAFQELPPLHCS